MKLMTTLLLAGALTVTAGCHKTAPTAPVPGAINTFDSTIYRALMDAQAAINSIRTDIQSGKLTETPGINTALNQVINDYNTADALWQAYHASQGQTSQAPVQAAVTKLQADVNVMVVTK